MSETMRLSPAASLRILTYNILHPAFALKHKTKEGISCEASGAPSNWPVRQPQLAANIEAAKADIVLLQEVGPEALPPLPPHMEFAKLCLHNYPDSATKSGNVIAYDRSRFNIGDMCLLLDDIGARRAAHAGLYDRYNKCSYAVTSAHISGYPPAEADYNKRAQIVAIGDGELRKLLQWHDDWTGYRLDIIGGDFNMDPREHDSRAMLLRRFNYQASLARTATEPRTGRELDFIHVKGHGPLLLGEPEIIWPYPHASDHLPRVTDIKFA